MKRRDIEQLLPGIFRLTLNRMEHNPLDAYLDIMELLHEPAEALMERLETYFDPYQGPDQFLPYLAGWVDLDQFWIDDPETVDPDSPPPFPTGAGRLRELLLSAAYLSKWRGTNKGLIRSLQIITGMDGFSIDERVPGDDGQPKPFHIRVTIAQAANPYRPLIERVIQIEKPAYVTYELS
jgi:phage tail-like protein